ncbi:hypothetical protein ACIQUQ_05150 [Streptomyces sp. NPDC101118]|uniref:hypothetical protein n=1 Tax=Streptomyces sp. NPDC101118 TaxID=3366109 RepID=UPI003825B0BA
MHSTAWTGGPPLPDICDLCRESTRAGTAVSGRAPDSSFAHPSDPEQDGARPLLACTEAHLVELQRHYGARPYVDEELWSVKIDRAMRRHPEGLSIDDLCRMTGLSMAQVESAAAWRLHHLRRTAFPRPPGARGPAE